MGTGRITDPTDRESFKAYIRALLGEPVIDLNVTEFQVDIAVDEALKYYRDYHYLGSWRAFYIYELTEQDIANRYFTLPDEIIGVVNVYDSTDVGGMGINTNLYSGAWQLNYDMIFNQGMATGSFLSYYSNKSYFDLLNSLIVGMKSIRFNMHMNEVYIDNSWVNYKAGTKIILDCWQTVDPDANPKVWSDRWLIRYAAAKVKRQMGENLAKFDTTLPGGVKVNYERIIAESQAEISAMETEMLRDYSEPPRDMIG